jgi:hypothetical protein
MKRGRAKKERGCTATSCALDPNDSASCPAPAHLPFIEMRRATAAQTMKKIVADVARDKERERAAQTAREAKPLAVRQVEALEAIVRQLELLRQAKRWW